MSGSGRALRVAERAVSARGGLPDYLDRRSAIELVLLDLLMASAAVIAVSPSSVRFDLGSGVALAAVIPGVAVLARAAASAAAVPGGLALDQLDPAREPGTTGALQAARHATAAGLGLLVFGSVVASAALLAL